MEADKLLWKPTYIVSSSEKTDRKILQCYDTSNKNEQRGYRYIVHIHMIIYRYSIIKQMTNWYKSEHGLN